LRPDRSSSILKEAVVKGLAAARQYATVMVALLAVMSLIVFIYYFWPAGAAVLSQYAAWQQAGGLFRTGLAAGFAGGVLSEVSSVYLIDGGRWTSRHLENMGFRFVIFFLGGLVVAEFYQWQAVWFGNGTSWRVLLPKVLVDQFVFSVFWSTSYQTVVFRWQALRFSGSALWKELDGRFVTERMLPVLVTNWMFWIPGVTLVYAMPLILQMPLNIFATAIWSLLLAGLAKPAHAVEVAVSPGLVLTEADPGIEATEPVPPRH
jgi:hypothetical protein